MTKRLIIYKDRVGKLTKRGKRKKQYIEGKEWNKLSSTGTIISTVNVILKM